MHCPCCDSSDLEAIYRVASIPVHSCILLDSREEALNFPRRDLELMFCVGCGFAFNHRLDESMIGYSAQFEESQHFSGTFNAFAKALAAETVDRCGIVGKRVVEIGCGKGEFLREVCTRGGSVGIGIDPAYRHDPGRNNAGDDLEFIGDYFSDEHRGLQADVVLCRHTLEHIPAPAAFVGAIRQLVGDDPERWVVFETPDFRRVLDEGAFWDIYYEHCSYFSAGSHARLFRQQSFDIVDLSLRYDRQYIYQYAKVAGDGIGPASDLESDLPDMSLLARSFPTRVKRTIDHWKRVVAEASASGRRVAVWGGGSKGVSFITTLGLTSEITAVADINLYKQGKFMPGSGHAVVSPQDLLREPPDVVIVMNPIYVPEVKAVLGSLALSPEVVAL